MFFIWCLLSFQLSDGAVLDPALYLSPSPPLISISDSNPEVIWTQPRNAPLNTKSIIDKEPANDQEAMVEAETFWPHIRSIHFPIQFHLTGTYGGFGGTGVVPSSYTNLSGTRVYGRPLNLSGFGTGSKLFGSQEASWSGWGNGKWGHYGKGK
ncbi:uncharacterized protein LOC111002691 [Pieris rapae]|uniref:uncharacterized protein LOC111002691 n=1 Tax=Pieris rapae TaxID=64459 RepID=UPI001E27D06E|nr:uncharacterized protein LOC111002691 [Pieris rapae]